MDKTPEEPLTKTNELGLPEITEAEQQAAASKSAKTISVMIVVATTIGFAIAAGIHAGDKDTYNARMASIKDADGHWGYLSAFLFGLMVTFLNMYPMIYKSQVMLPKSGNLRANMLIYKMTGPQSVPGAIVLETDGMVGAYNRANRSLNHFVENMAPWAVSMYMASNVFPQAVFTLTVLFVFGRIAHQVGYSSPKGYGNHGVGFLLGMLTTITLQGLLLIVAMYGFGTEL